MTKKVFFFLIINSVYVQPAEESTEKKQTQMGPEEAARLELELLV